MYYTENFDTKNTCTMTKLNTHKKQEAIETAKKMSFEDYVTVLRKQNNDAFLEFESGQLTSYSLINF